MSRPESSASLVPYKSTKDYPNTVVHAGVQAKDPQDPMPGGHDAKTSSPGHKAYSDDDVGVVTRKNKTWSLIHDSAKFRQLQRAAALMEDAERDASISPGGSGPSFYGCSALGRGTVVNGISIESNCSTMPKHIGTLSIAGARYKDCIAENGGSVVNGINFVMTKERATDSVGYESGQS